MAGFSAPARGARSQFARCLTSAGALPTIPRQQSRWLAVALPAQERVPGRACWQWLTEEFRITQVLAALVVAVGTLGFVASPAGAAGCLKGAVVGGVAGHYVGRGHGALRRGGRVPRWTLRQEARAARR